MASASVAAAVAAAVVVATSIMTGPDGPVVPDRKPIAVVYAWSASIPAECTDPDGKALGHGMTGLKMGLTTLNDVPGKISDICPVLNKLVTKKGGRMLSYYNDAKKAMGDEDCNIGVPKLWYIAGIPAEGADVQDVSRRMEGEAHERAVRGDYSLSHPWSNGKKRSRSGRGYTEWFFREAPPPSGDEAASTVDHLKAAALDALSNIGGVRFVCDYTTVADDGDSFRSVSRLRGDGVLASHSTEELRP